MGVTGLWTVVAPTARPTSLASLNRKRLAVDASIWIYQFLKAVRDKEGNALRNSHVVGFFRRICKLLYFGIKPVFVFDGGAPNLKRETILRRKRRREGRRDDAVRTAARLISLQMERVAAEEAAKAKAKAGRRKDHGDDNDGHRDDDDDDDQGWQGDESDLVYVDEIGMDKAQRQRERRQQRQQGGGPGFRKTDQYHLPDLDISIESLRGAEDPRIMSQAELEEYARQFHSGEDVNLYDFSKIDFESPFFLSLPAADRYNILNAARLRSRLRMGYSKEQLDAMFPDRMAFSRFQIERVKERNDLTQRLMHLNGMSDMDAAVVNQGGRIAGEKGKEYVLVRNEGVEGGWALGVVSNKKRLGANQEHAIDLDAPAEDDYDDHDDAEKNEHENEEDEFEDVAIEGLNRLPRAWKRKRKDVAEQDMSYDDAVAEIARKRKAVYDARRQAAAAPASDLQPQEPTADGDDALFVAQDSKGVNPTRDNNININNVVDDDDDLFEDVNIEPRLDEDDDLQRAIAMSLEQPTALEVNNAVSKFTDTRNDDDDDDGIDLQTALAQSRSSKSVLKPTPAQPNPAPTPKFDGPLPFESLNLGQSLLGKKKAKKIEEDLSGGFDRNLGNNDGGAFGGKEKPPQPIPSWFEAAPRTEDLRAPPRGGDDDQTSSQNIEPAEKVHRGRPHYTQVIDLEAEPETEAEAEKGQVFDISSDEEDEREHGERERDLAMNRERLEWEMPEEVEAPILDAQEELVRKREEEEREKRYRMAQEIAGQVDESQSMSDHNEQPAVLKPNKAAEIPYTTGKEITKPKPAVTDDHRDEEEEEDEEEGEFEDVQVQSPARAPSPLAQLEQQVMRSVASGQETTEVEQYLLPEEDEVGRPKDSRSQPVQPSVAADYGDNDDGGQDYLSEPDAEEEELMRQLAIEAEEHARFANSLNNNNNNNSGLSSTNNSAEEAARDYENELKQLRNQQKRDRRDADEVTQVMIEECQALLSLFGLPYITAPMEAEAQCAELVHLGLVDGIVTDDSDIFLFGGTRIYKNMFNAAKFVECYLASDLEKEYALDRQKLIRFAHLLGSDYTEGIPGVGPVTALEIITDFSNLAEFKDWCSKIQLLGPGPHTNPENEQLETSTPFRRKFQKTARKKIFLPPNFPDSRVDEAYLNPEVDSDPEEFQWGVPDLDKLRSFLMATVGWSQERTDEILVPVVRDMNQRAVEGTQANITRFFSGTIGAGVNPNHTPRNNTGGTSTGGVGAGPGGASDAAAAPRNKTGKESGRMKNAYKRLRIEAERSTKQGTS